MKDLAQALQTIPDPRKIEADVPKMHVLLIGKVPSIIEPVHRFLKDMGHDISIAPNEEAGFSSISWRAPDLIFLELTQPELPEFATCQRLKAEERSRSIPIIFIGDELSTEEIVKGFSLGAADYLVKPFGRAEVQTRACAHLEIQKLRREKEELVRQLRFSSKTDPLTGLPNRQAMLNRLEKEQFHFHRYKRPFSVVHGDIDGFKKVKEEHGHDAEEMALLHVAKILAEHCRRTDFVCRWAGDEFLLLLPETDGDGAAILAEKMRKLVSAQHVMDNFKKISLSMSFGIGVHNDETLDAEHAVQAAEKNMYRAKQRGRNKVVG